jgi:hypothetical protein
MGASPEHERRRSHEAEAISDEQIVGVLHDAAATGNAREVCPKHGITETTFYCWRVSRSCWPYRGRRSDGGPLTLSFMSSSDQR